MLGRNGLRLIKQFVPPVLGFLLGYILRSLQEPPEEEETGFENVRRNLFSKYKKKHFIL